jgi:hypothetical protein
MERELRELELQIVIRFEFLDTPGDEVAPGSDKVGKHFENKRFGHKHLRSLKSKIGSLIEFYGPLLPEVNEIG